MFDIFEIFKLLVEGRCFFWLWAPECCLVNFLRSERRFGCLVNMFSLPSFVVGSNSQTPGREKSEVDIFIRCNLSTFFCCQKKRWEISKEHQSF